jgi:hypothetical protein
MLSIPTVSRIGTWYNFIESRPEVFGTRFDFAGVASLVILDFR